MQTVKFQALFLLRLKNKYIEYSDHKKQQLKCQ